MIRSRELHGHWVTPPTTAAEFDGLLKRREDESFVSLVIRLRGDGRIAGLFNISEIVRRVFQRRVRRLGGSAWEGQGYMTEGMRLVLDHAFTDMGLHRLEAKSKPGNVASILLVGGSPAFVREGFKYLKLGGKWRDHERWAIRAELWEARGREGA